MNKHIILLFIILCIGLTRASAQHSITGKVLDLSLIHISHVEGLKDTGFKGQFRFLRTPAPWLILGATALGNGCLLYTYYCILHLSHPIVLLCLHVQRTKQKATKT